MRLGQLARKLDISTSQIIEFLSNEDQTTIEGNNSKLSENQIVLVTSEFDTHLTEEIIAKNEDVTSDGKGDSKKSVDDYIVTCANQNKEPEKPFKGSLNVRIGKELHKACAYQALIHNISINEYIKLAIKDHVGSDLNDSYPMD